MLPTPGEADHSRVARRPRPRPRPRRACCAGPDGSASTAARRRLAGAAAERRRRRPARPRAAIGPWPRPSATRMRGAAGPCARRAQASPQTVLARTAGTLTRADLRAALARGRAGPRPDPREHRRALPGRGVDVERRSARRRMAPRPLPGGAGGRVAVAQGRASTSAMPGPRSSAEHLDPRVPSTARSRISPPPRVLDQVGRRLGDHEGQPCPPSSRRSPARCAERGRGAAGLADLARRRRRHDEWSAVQHRVTSSA